MVYSKKNIVRPRVRLPNHPRSTPDGRVRIHILVAEEALGKALPTDAVVHHADGNPLNNQNSNLIICQDTAYHGLLESRTRALILIGDVHSLYCWICQSWSLPDKSDIVSVNRNGRRNSPREFVHRSCRKAYMKHRREVIRGSHTIPSR